jgi:hypothetical protein
VVPEDVQRRWAEKHKQIADAGADDLALPHASMAMLALAGIRRDPELLDSIQMLMRLSPDEVPLDGGAAGCRAIDSVFYDEYAATGTRPRGMRALEAAWLATDEAFYYIAPNVQQYRRWAWGDVRMKSSRRGRRFARVEMESTDAKFTFRLGSNAMDNLMAVYSWSRPRRFGGN